MGALDELLAKWRNNPDADATLALCTYLASSPRQELIEEVGATAEAWHRDDPAVMLAVGRLYLDINLLPQAQAALVAAGQGNPSDPLTYRYLGEVLLRRGDAVRAEKVLARSVQLGQADPETRRWHDRAAVFVGLQTRNGMSAVADEIARTMPSKAPEHSKPPPIPSKKRTELGLVPSLPRDDDMPPSSRTARTQAVLPPSAPPKPPSAPPKPPSAAPKPPPVRPQVVVRRGSTPPAALAPSSAPSDLHSQKYSAAALPRADSPPPSSNRYGAVVEPMRARIDPMPDTRRSPIRRPTPKPPPRPPGREPPQSRAPSERPPQSRAPSERPPPPPASFFPPSPPQRPIRPIAPIVLRGPEVDEDDEPTRISHDLVAKANAAPGVSTPPPPPPPPKAPSLTSTRPPAVRPPTLRPTPPPPPRPFAGAADDAGTARPPEGDVLFPTPQVVLNQLARVGVYEHKAGGAATWEKAPRERNRGAWVLAFLLVLSVGANAAGFTYVKKLKSQRADRVRALERDAAASLHGRHFTDFSRTDALLSSAFDLDSRSQTGALLSLRSRVLSGLVGAQQSTGIGSAIRRCEHVGVAPERMAFARVANFLSDDDLIGAAAAIAKWDAVAQRDPYFQLVVGAVLERAGDLRAVGRYKRAFELDPKLTIARILHAHLVALEFGAEAAAPLVSALDADLGSHPVTNTLHALLWTLKSDLKKPADSEWLDEKQRDQLPLPLRPVPEVFDALSVASTASDPNVKLARALELSTSPASATWIGYTAITLGNETLAREAVRRALGYSSLYPRARALAARVALQGAHLDEAMKGAQELDPHTPELIIARAAAAYEKLDVSGLERALLALPKTDHREASRALLLASDVITGASQPAPEALRDVAKPGVAWGELIAMDAALDEGELYLAEILAGRWTERAEMPTYAVRLARLHRYQHKTDKALHASEVALVENEATPRAVIERFYSLMAAGNPDGAAEIVDRYGNLIGTSRDYLQASADWQTQKPIRAKNLAARLPLPASNAPLLYRLVAAKTLALVGDARAREYVKELAKQYPKQPDLVDAARAVGVPLK